MPLISQRWHIEHLMLTLHHLRSPWEIPVRVSPAESLFKLPERWFYQFMLHLSLQTDHVINDRPQESDRSTLISDVEVCRNPVKQIRVAKEVRNMKRGVG